MAYATASDLESRWRALSPSERERAETLLVDASEILASRGYSSADGNVLRIVACNMVRRAMTSDGDAFGLDGQATPSDVWGDSLPAGELYIKGREASWLSCGPKMATIPMADLNG